MTPAEAREVVKLMQFYLGAGAPAIPHIEERTIDAASGKIRVRLYDPGTPAPAPAVVFLHGGGWVTCDIDIYDGTARQLAKRSGLRLVSVNYALAPEHPFPIPLDDCVAAVRWVLANGAKEFGIDPARVAIAGDSSGANLALASCLKLRQSGPIPLRGAALIYGCYSRDTDTLSSRAYGGGAYLISKPEMEWYWENYVQTDEACNDPLAAPLLADLKGLPPLYHRRSRVRRAARRFRTACRARQACRRRDRIPAVEGHDPCLRQPDGLDRRHGPGGRPDRRLPAAGDGEVIASALRRSSAPRSAGDARGRSRSRARRRRRGSCGSALGSSTPSIMRICAFSPWPAPTMVFFTRLGAYSATGSPAIAGTSMRDAARLPELERRGGVLVDESRLDRGLVGRMLGDHAAQAVVDGDQPLRQRRLVVGRERAAGEEAEPVAFDRNHAPAGAAEPRIDPQDANRSCHDDR